MNEDEGQKQLATTSLVSVIERLATSPDVDVGKMEKMLDMQERILDKQAEQQFNTSMVAAQLEMPVIKPDGQNDQTRSVYAKYETINKVIKPVYTKHGFSMSFGQQETVVADHIRVFCDVSHIGGHTKSYFMDLPMDDSGIKGNVNKTPMHGTASTFSYGQRYLAKLIFNITVSGEDDDGNAAGGDTRTAMEITEWWVGHMAEIRDLFSSIAAIKEGIALNDLPRAIEALSELSNAEKQAIWSPAPTKGGILTTQERTVIRSNEWHAASQELREGNHG